MSKQYNKAEKRVRRKAYLKRKRETTKVKAAKAQASKTEEPAAKV
jgi:hypothetical protein